MILLPRSVFNANFIYSLKVDRIIVSLQNDNTEIHLGKLKIKLISKRTLILG